METAKKLTKTCRTDRERMMNKRSMRCGERMMEIWREDSGMELVQVGILIAIAVGLGLIFKLEISTFVNDVFSSLTANSFK